MQNTMLNGPILKESLVEELLSLGGPTQLTVSFVLLGRTTSLGACMSGTGKAFCSLKMSSIHNCAFSEFGCSHFLGRCESYKINTSKIVFLKVSPT